MAAVADAGRPSRSALRGRPCAWIGRPRASQYRGSASGDRRRAAAGGAVCAARGLARIGDPRIACRGRRDDPYRGSRAVRGSCLPRYPRAVGHCLPGEGPRREVPLPSASPPGVSQGRGLAAGCGSGPARGCTPERGSPSAARRSHGRVGAIHRPVNPGTAGRRTAARRPRVAVLRYAGPRVVVVPRVPGRARPLVRGHSARVWPSGWLASPPPRRSPGRRRRRRR